MLWLFALACPDGKVPYAEFTIETLRYSAATVTQGGGIGAQSDGCRLPVTPTGQTFSIWSFIYSHQNALLFPRELTEEEMFHVAQVYDITRTWLDSFVERDGDNAVAASAIHNMTCHVSKARQSACEADPRKFACCSFSQYETWLRVAGVLSDLILQKYGSRCGTPLLDDATINQQFADLAGKQLSLLPSGDGVARRSALATAAWALRGVCDARNGDCPAVSKDYDSQTVSDVELLADQTLAALGTSLACALY